MDIHSINLIYFSPTGTTRRILESIADGIQPAHIAHLDLTPPAARTTQHALVRNNLVIIGTPVYAGRLPAETVTRLQPVRGNGAPAVIVVTYGNRAFDDALLELRDAVQEAGFKPIAAGAFIGEHSFSTDTAPIAPGRPDGDDLKKAQEFGRLIREKIQSVQTLDGIAKLQVPGNFPYKQGSALSGISPVTRGDACAKCEECAAVCPTGAITVQDTVITDGSSCIRCCACVKACSTGARVMGEPRIRQIAEQLSINCRQRKEPELYI